MVDVDTRRRDEVRALAELAFDELGRAVGGVGAVHRAISDRVFAAVQLGVGPWATPSRILHNAIADGTYASIVAACEVAGEVASRAVDGRGRTPSETRHGAVALGALTGLIGDALAEQDSPLATPMSVRVDGRVRPTDPRSLAQAYPAASSTVVFFAHGLMETEVAWAIGGRPTYGSRLTADLGFSEVQVRYNTGRHISENGREFAALIGDVVANWPVPVKHIAVVGHSMGGLVARSACHGAAEAGQPWTRLVRHIVCLGSPHLGAPLARTVHTTTALLQVFPESRPFGGLLRRRSAGIRDLYAGSLVDEDWSGRDLDALRQAAIAEVPLLADADHSFVSASITRDPDHLLGRHLGDGLVMHVSARGRDKLRDIGFNDADGMHLGSAHHFTLLNNDAVYDWLADRLRGR